MKIKDGTAEFRVRDQRLKAMVDLFFHVGAIYTCVTKPPWMEEYGEWQEVGAGRVLWGADDIHKAGTEIKAGLPNITGHDASHYSSNHLTFVSGAFTASVPISSSESGRLGATYGDFINTSISRYYSSFDASKSNPIYGASDTVQPPAYVVHFYQRIS